MIRSRVTAISHHHLGASEPVGRCREHQRESPRHEEFPHRANGAGRPALASASIAYPPRRRVPTGRLTRISPAAINPLADLELTDEGASLRCWSGPTNNPSASAGSTPTMSRCWRCSTSCTSTSPRKRAGTPSSRSWRRCSTMPTITFASRSGSWSALAIQGRRRTSRPMMPFAPGSTRWSNRPVRPVRPGVACAVLGKWMLDPIAGVDAELGAWLAARSLEPVDVVHPAFERRGEAEAVSA